MRLTFAHEHSRRASRGSNRPSGAPRPYTFVVLAILILIFGVLAAVRTPTDIFPDIKIPVIAVVWTYRGLPPDDMAGRVIYYYERQLSTAVNDIEHIESQSLTGIGIVKIFFQPGVDIRTATAQVTSLSQTVLKQMPPGITPPLILNYNASTVPILQLALSSPQIARTEAVRSRAEFHPPVPGDGPGLGDSLALWRQGAADPDRSRSAGAAGQGPVGRGRRQCARGAEPDHPGRHDQDRPVRIQCEAQRQPRARSTSSTTCRSRPSTARRSTSATSPMCATAFRRSATSCAWTAGAPC